MDSTDLLRFLQDLVDNPQELRKYKQNPAEYVAQAGFPPDMQQLLHQFSSSTPTLGTVFEISTVFQLDISSNSLENPKIANPPSSGKDLSGTPIKLICHSSPVIIERTETLHCRLLRHSYVDQDNGVPFKLHLSYSYPYDPTDQAFVIEITTEEPIPAGSSPDRGDAKVILSAPKAAIVLTYDTWVPRTLAEGSYYNPLTGELTLAFEQPSSTSSEI